MFTMKLTNLYVTDVVLTTKPLTGSLKVQELLTKTRYQSKLHSKLETVVIDTEDFILKGREQDRLKISMPAIP
jgi:hypothetical protein